jgi:hypothetical protein
MLLDLINGVLLFKTLVSDKLEIHYFEGEVTHHQTQYHNIGESMKFDKNTASPLRIWNIIDAKQFEQLWCVFLKY